jgi:hypothetical protein
MRRGDLTDQQWQRLELLLLPEKPWTGRPNEDHLCAPAGTFCDLSGAGALDDIVQGKQSLAGTGMRGRQCKVAQVGRRLTPAFIINA